MGAGLEAGLGRVTAALDESLARTAGYRVKVALENTAGAGNTIGRTFGELATLIERAARPERIGVCLDTCHLFAAGYNIRTAPGYRRAMAECEATIGRRRVVAFHLNDAKAPLGSGLDRHENIGRGLLGLAPFRLLLKDRRFAAVPKVLETPKEPAPASDRFTDEDWLELIMPPEADPFLTAIFALISGGLIWVQLRMRAHDNSLPVSALMLGGSLYLVFIAYTIFAVVSGATSVSLR